MFIKYLTHQIPPKKSKGKGSKGRKIVDDSQETVDVSEESKPEPELAKKKSSTEEAEAERKVHTIHARIVTEFVPESAKNKSSGKSSKSVVIKDTPSTPKSKPATSKTKLKGAPSLTLQEQEAANIMQALKESKKIRRRQPGTGGSNEGTGSKPGGDEQDSELSDDDNDDVEKDDKDGDADDEGDDHDDDVEMKDAEFEGSEKGDEEITDAAEEEAEKTLEAKDDTKKTELPPSRSSLYVSLGFGDQFLKLSSDSSLVSTVKDSTDADRQPIFHLYQKLSLKLQLQLLNPHLITVQQTTTPIPTPKITTDAPTVTTAIPKSNVLTIVELRVAKLEKDVSELKIVDHSSKALTVLQSYNPTVIDS
ncbi:hypothetical protein Tco_0646698 [Tanacetum coccineum]